MRKQVFLDVPAGTQFFDDMGWLADMKVTTGWEVSGGAKFRPATSVNRDAMAAFMYRLAGEPQFTPPSVSPFTDVTPDTQFYKEITWLAAEGISTGWEVAGGREFRPVTPVNRDAMAAFMYRYAGEPAYTASASSPFADVTSTTQFYKEISWLAAEGITTGWEVSGGREFRPVQPVNRDAMAAFMHRFARGAAITLYDDGIVFIDALPLGRHKTWTEMVGASGPLAGTEQLTVRLGADTLSGAKLSVTVANADEQPSAWVDVYVLDERGVMIASSPGIEPDTGTRIVSRSVDLPAAAAAIRIEPINDASFAVTR